MNFLYKVFALCLFLSTVYTSAQTQSDYTLQSNQVKVFEKSAPLNSTLLKSGNTLEWTQNINGVNTTITYTIQQITGNWNANNSKGDLTYTLYREGFSSVTFNLKGSNSGSLQAVLSVKQGDNPALQYIFNPTNITYL